MVEIETIFSRTHYRRIQNVMKYIKVIPRNSCKGFPYRSRNFISSNDSFEDVSGMEVSRDDWKAGNGRTGQSFLCPASSANDLHPRSCMNQGGSYGDASLRVMNIYEQVQRRFHSCEISQREFVKKQTPPFRTSTSTWNYLLQLCMIQLNPLTV